MRPDQGQPVTTTDADSASCDLYSLHLSGYGAGGKASIALGEVAADVFTLGIAEIVSTPTEALTRNKTTPVWFCYKNDTLARITSKRVARRLNRGAMISDAHCGRLVSSSIPKHL
jgi:hypothetical protein